LLLIVLPWYIFEKEVSWDILNFDRNHLFIIVYIGVAYLLYTNIKTARRAEGNAKTASLIFIIPPALVLLFFIAGYFAFSGFTGF